jgi:predicted amidophosphoribosyltransferase
VAARITFEKRVTGWLSRAGDALASVFFPAGCRLCERLLIRASAVPIGEECLASFPALGGVLCNTCGQPLGAWSLSDGSRERGGEGLVCPECKSRSYGFDRVRSYALYKGPLVRAIMLLACVAEVRAHGAAGPVVRRAACGSGEAGGGKR